MTVVAAINSMDAIPNYLRGPGRLEREVVVQPLDPGKRLELLRGMLLCPLMASRPHEGNKPSMDNNEDK